MLENIKITKLYPNPDNPRKNLGDLTELAESIKAAGVLQSLTVVPKDGEKGSYTVIAGHRRLAAAKLAKIKELPCITSDMDKNAQMAAMLVENLQRSDLTVPEQAHGFQMMMDLSETVQTIAKKTGFSEKTVRSRVFIATLDTQKATTAQERGATLEDYMKLKQVAGDEKREKVLETLGTNNFNQALRTAMDEEFRDKVAPKIIKLLEKFATHTEKPRHELKGYGYFGCCRYKDFEKSGELGIRIPIEFSSDEYLYYIDLNDIEVYKRVVEQNATNATKKMSELPPAEQEKRREKRRKYKALKEISETAYNLRLEFVRAFSRKTINAAEIKALSELAFAAVCFGGKLELSIYSKAEDIQLGSTWQMSYSQKKELAKGTAPKVLLMALYSTFRDSADNRYYNTTSETTAEQAGSHKENSMLDAIYECLCTLGYVMSDDEKALQDGTHENFNSESSAEIKAAA